MKKLLFILTFFVSVLAYGQADPYHLLGPYDVASDTVDVNNGNAINGYFTVQCIGDSGGNDFNSQTLYIQASLDGTNYTTITKSDLTALTITDDIIITIFVNGYVRLAAGGTMDVDVYFSEVVTDTQ